MDLDAIHAWGASLTLSLIEDHEFALLRVQGLGEAFRQRGMAWRQMPIADLKAPDGYLEGRWEGLGPLPRWGLGRAGTVGCMLLMELGATYVDALQKVRAARPGAVETAAQERYLASYAPRLLGAVA